MVTTDGLTTRHRQASASILVIAKSTSQLLLRHWVSLAGASRTYSRCRGYFKAGFGLRDIPKVSGMTDSLLAVRRVPS